MTTTDLDEPGLSPLRLKALRFQFWLTIIVTIPLGLFIMLLPNLFQRIAGIPRQDHTYFGISGAVYMAFGLLSFLGLRNPLKFSPLLLLQFTYKMLWFLLVMGRRAAFGQLPKTWPNQAMMLGYGIFIIGDICAMPLGYLCGRRR